MNPFETLIIGIIFLIVAGIIIWPDKGILARWKKNKANTKKILIEDALKHLYDFEYKNLDCTLHSLAGHLSISGDEVAILSENLQKMDLIISREEKLQLTNKGRSYALKIIRVHRLWEKYLADETGIDERKWHLLAEREEHFIDENAADELANKMGNPAFDPHGDPIPTATGDLPVRKGIPLTELKQGESAKIIHIEDEPLAIYSQILAERLYPGMQIRITETDKERIRFIAEGDEKLLSPLIANNITVTLLHVIKKAKENLRSLSSLKIGEEGVVLEISKACRGQQRRRLMDFGIVPGTKIKAELQSAGKDPTAYYIRGALIALRKDQSDFIIIKQGNEKEIKNEQSIIK